MQNYTYMALKNSFSNANGVQRVLILMLLILVGFMSLGMFTGFIAAITGDLNAVLGPISEDSPMSRIRIMKVVQMGAQVFIFALPALGYTYLTKRSGVLFMRFHKWPQPYHIGMAALITLLAIPFINLLGQWSMQWHLPAFLSDFEASLRTTQELNDNAILAFTKMPSIGDVLTNIVMMALLPAVCEELLFRGVIQRELHKATRNHHVAIWISAFLFSALHGQFFGLFSRMLLGALFGYLYFYSKNLRLAIVGHFTNNILALALVFFFGTDQMEASFDEPFGIPTIIGTSVLFIASVLLLFYWSRKRIV
jgi:membrane protease YdiL (CAAX protease family)